MMRLWTCSQVATLMRVSNEAAIPKPWTTAVVWDKSQPMNSQHWSSQPSSRPGYPARAYGCDDQCEEVIAPISLKPLESAGLWMNGCSLAPGTFLAPRENA